MGIFKKNDDDPTHYDNLKGYVEYSFKRNLEDDSAIDAGYHIEVKDTEHVNLTSTVRMYKYIDVDGVPDELLCDAMGGDVDRWERKDWNIRDRLLKEYTEKAFNADGAVNKVDYYIEVLGATNKPNCSMAIKDYKLRLHKTIDVCVDGDVGRELGGNGSWHWGDVRPKKSTDVD